MRVILRLLLFGAAAALLGPRSSAPVLVRAGFAEDRAAALESHRQRLARQANYHSPDRVEPDHRGHPGHGGEHMHEVPHETLLEHHDLHHHEVGTLPVKHRLPAGQHDIPDHQRPAKDQRGDHHNPPEHRHVLRVSDQHDFGIDMHTGRKRVKMKDLKEHVWDKDDPDHPHAHRRATKRQRRRKFPNHPRRKYDWMEDETRRLAHAHTEALRAGDTKLAEELAHNQTALNKELRHLEMLHHGMTEEEYQEFKGWQAELEQLNAVDSHAMAREEKVKHRDRMVELGRLIQETREHFELVPQPNVHPHATLEDNIKMHKLWEAIHKTDHKGERAQLKKALQEHKSTMREESKHRIYSEEEREQIRALRQQLEETDEDDHLERDKLRMAIQEVYLEYERREAAAHGHLFGPRAHDEAKKKAAAHDEHAPKEDKPSTDPLMDDPEIKELHEELHHVENHQYEEKKRIENRIKMRTYELKHRGAMHHDHIRGHLDAAVNLTEQYLANHKHEQPREPEPPPDRRAKPIIVM